jgi:hypothetical protein
MKKIVLAAIAAIAFNASAAELSFNNLGLTYQQLDSDCSSDCDGFGINGSVEFSDMFNAGIDYANYEGDVSLTYLHLGIRHEMSENAAVFGQVGAARIDAFSDNDTKAFAGVGVRGMIAEQFEGEALVRKVFVSGVDPSLKLTGTYFFTETVGGQLFAETSDGDTGYGLGLRVNF